jgi:hypothetical protein
MFDEDRGDSLEELLRRLTEAIDWCAHRASLTNPESLADPNQFLRTPRLAPDPLAGDRKRVVASVAGARRVALKWPEPRPAEHLAGGRLLAYAPDYNLACGAAEAETNGYLDVNNVPPWDTWVAYVYESERRQYVVSWVPPNFVDAVALGIYVNPEGCIWWADETTDLLASLLQKKGIHSATTRRQDDADPMWDRDIDG